MMYAAEYKGIWFVEGLPQGCQLLGDISTELNEVFGQSQLKSLDDVKDRMVVAARKAGGNAIVDFKYGQQSTFWKSFLGMDSVWWFGRGRIARIKFDG